MVPEIKITPADPIVQDAIQITYPAVPDISLPVQAKVVPTEPPAPSFFVPLTKKESVLTGQFSLAIPGRYEVSLGEVKKLFQVGERQNVGALTEVSYLLGVSLIIALGGILWIQRRGNSGAGSI